MLTWSGGGGGKKGGQGWGVGVVEGRGNGCRLPPGPDRMVEVFEPFLDSEELT